VNFIFREIGVLKTWLYYRYKKKPQDRNCSLESVYYPTDEVWPNCLSHIGGQTTHKIS